MWIFVLKSNQFTLQDSGSIVLLSYQGDRYNKTFYLATYFKTDWLKAYQFCKSSGMSLAAFETQDEYQKVYDEIATNLTTMPETAKITGVYFGIFRDNPFKNTTYKHYETNKFPQIKFNWHKGEPFNLNGIQYCMQIVKRNGTWGK